LGDEVSAILLISRAPQQVLRLTTIQSQHPEVGGLDDQTDIESNRDDSSLFFEPEHDHPIEELANFHPSLEILLKLQNVYIDRVDPLIKILHPPTVWPALTNALRCPQDRPKTLEALMFAFYLSTILTLTGEECQLLFGVEKPALRSRYRLATRQALINAKFLSTSSLMTLQAYAMFMVSLQRST
jgi:hypothetical protein